MERWVIRERGTDFKSHISKGTHKRNEAVFLCLSAV